MANPLRVFRKYQYALLVGFGIMLMFAFVVAPPLSDYLQTRAGTAGGQNPVVVTWKGGELREADIVRLRTRHLLTTRFLQRLLQRVEAVEAVTVNWKGEQVALIKGMSYPYVGRSMDADNAPVYQIMLQGEVVDVPQSAVRSISPKVEPITQASSEEELVQRLMLAEKAKEMGVVISEAAVQDYLDNLCDVTDANRPDYAELLREATSGRLDTKQFMAQMLVELAAQRMLIMSQGGLLAATPELIYECYNRLNRRVTAELLAVDVADFVAEVPEPADAEVTALYEEGKDRFPSPLSPDPGFKRRERVAFGYFKGVFDEFLQREMDAIRPTITNEQIEKYYEENKATEFKMPELPPDEPAPSPPADTQAAPEATPPAATPEATPEPAPESPTDTPQTPPADSAPVQEPAAAPPAAEPPADAPGSDAAGADPAAGSPQESQPAGQDSDSTSRFQEAPSRIDDVMLVSFEGAQDPPSEPAPQEPAPQEPAPQEPAPQEPAPQEPAPQESAPQEPAPQEPAPQEPAPQEPAPQEPAPPEPAADAPALSEPAPSGQDPAAGQPAAEGAAKPAAEPVKYKPLDDALREEIRTTLARRDARQPAQEKLEQAVEQARGLVERYAQQLSRAQVLENAAPPTPLDYEAIAQQYNLSHNKAPLLDMLDIAQIQQADPADDDPPHYEFARATETLFGQQSGMMRRTLIDVAFDDQNIALFVPRRLVDGILPQAGFPIPPEKLFIYWREEVQPEELPPLDRIRDEVVAAWKMRQALPLARAKAEQLAKQVADAGKPLSEVLVDNAANIIRSNPFSWMTRGALPGSTGAQPMLSSVTGTANGQPVTIAGAGQDFMRAVFDLNVGQVGVAVNQPQRFVYVVRVESEDPPEEQRRDAFFAAGITPEVDYLVRMEQSDIVRDWYSGLEKDFQITWQRTPERNWRFD